MKILVIVESPGKIKKLQSYLGSDYTVASSVGHIIDLPSKSLSVDVDHDFEPTYSPLPGKTQVIKTLKGLTAKSKEVIIASDKDREGEMIGWSLAKILGLKDPKRIVFGEITKSEIMKALSKPTKINQDLVNAQKARRILDRILGYYLSPLLWKNVLPGLSAGRVQSVVVKLILEREREIQKFLEDEVSRFFRFTGDFSDKNTKYSSVLYDKKTIAKIESKTDAKKFIEQCTKSVFTVGDITKTTSSRSPGRPFTTSTLQQEAGRKLGFNVKRTMMAAQNLYEAGHITYMRTDSVHISKEIIKSTGEFIKKKYGSEYHKEREYTSKGKNTQEAHEAVRPTNITQDEVSQKGKIRHDEVKLYSLIWKRTVGSQMSNAIFDVTTMDIDVSKSDKYQFRSVFNNLKFPGFLTVYNVKDLEDVDEHDDKNVKLPKKGVKLGCLEILGKTEFKSPPSRYNEPSLVKELDPETGLNIGRPATYSQIITRIQEKGYVEFRDVVGKTFEGGIFRWKGKGGIEEEKTETVLGSDKNRLVPTAMGELVTDYLESRFTEIMDYKFTAKMEDSLDDIASGTAKWVSVLKDFYKKFVPIVDKVKQEKSIKETKRRSLGVIDGEEVTVLFGKYGPYIQLGDSKIKKAPIKPPLTFDSVTLKDAKTLLEYPKLLGKIGIKQVLLKKGKYGLYVNVGQDNIPVENENITIDDIKQKLADKKKDNALKSFTDGTRVYKILNGPYGRFVNVSDTKDKKIKINASISEDLDLEKLTLDDIKQKISDHFEKKRNRFKKK